MLFLYLITIILLLISILVISKFKQKNYPPGPRGFPIIGSLLSLDPKEPYKSLTKLSQLYGPIFGIRMGSVYTVVLSDPKLIRATFAKDDFSGRAPLYLTHGIMNGYGVICAEGEIWREQRKFVLATLKNLGAVKNCVARDVMEKRIKELSNEAIQKLRAASINNKNGVDPLSILHHCVGNVMNNLVFGTVYNEDDEIWKWLRELQEEGVKHIGIAGPLNFLPFLRYLPRYKRMMESLIDGKLETHKYYRKLIDQYEENIRSNEDCNSDHFLGAFYDEMTRRQNNNNNVGSFTDQQYYHLLADLFGAGVDTTLTTMRWFLLYIAAFPEQQEKIYEEIKTVLGDQEISLEDSTSLLLLQAAICEVQRIRSVVPVGIPHGTSKDTKIADFDIPKGAMIIPLQWAVHMNPNYWENPEEFIPERFISPDGFLIKPPAFIPFQTGKRMCVGDELARMIMFIFIGQIVKEFKVSIPDNEPVDLNGYCGITLIPKNNKLIFTPRR